MQKDLFKRKLCADPAFKLPVKTQQVEETNEENPTKKSKKYTISLWDQYFDTKQKVTLPNTNDSFCVYNAGTSGPLFLLLHGAGHTSLSWALVASQLKHTCQVIAYDYRGHGSSSTANDTDLSLQTLSSDTILVLQHLYPEDSPRPPLIVVGHSLGGSVAVDVVQSKKLGSWPVGVVVVDCVEDTAVNSLTTLESYITKKIPQSFPSIEDAIEWSIRSGTLQLHNSAQISIPPQLIPSPENTTQFTWRTDLRKSKQDWDTWFKGMSTKFLMCPTVKVLMLAGTDRLDTTLMIGQMQGKFQVVMLPRCGHQIQEDDPTAVADALLDVVKRYGI
eukprot:TRINITY_DN6800_c0_g1_i1.p1 TRINITY_DN6800_c0_g1~~TRINITY_DN6800_c0_g1_i1.p1  ORF type:complete len:332 (-),score=42.90 TRINITY_DN6800_c0_g1_i1:33-1028(-)